MGNGYFIRRDGHITGPHSASHLKDLAFTGGINESDEVSRDQQSWVPAKDVAGLTIMPVAFEPPEPTPIPKNLEACPDCTEMVSLRANSCPHCGCPIRVPSLPVITDQYVFLRILAVVYWIVGLLMTGLGIVAAVIAAEKTESDPASALLVLTVYGLAALICFSSAQGIIVFLRIEENTRRSAEMLERRR